MGPWFKMLFEVFKKKCRAFNAITMYYFFETFTKDAD